MDIYINKYLCDFLSLPLHGESDKRLFVKTRKKAKPDRKHQTLSNSWKWLGSGKKKKEKKETALNSAPSVLLWTAWRAVKVFDREVYVSQ